MTAAPAAVPAETLGGFCRSLFLAADLAPGSAALVADVLVEAQLRGVESHGLRRAPHYLRALIDGVLDVTAEPAVTTRRGAVASVDGRNALGIVTAMAAADLAAELASASGIGAVAVRNSNHFGPAFPYALRAVRDGFVGFVTTNGPPVMPAFGGRAPAICNNPLAWAIPTQHRPPVVLDMACTVVARGRIRHAFERGDEIPLGWALDSAGMPTSDPAIALGEGSLQATGGPKGYGIAVVNEILAGALPAAQMLAGIPSGYVEHAVLDEPQRLGHFMLALDPAAFGTTDFPARVDQIVAELKRGEPAAGTDEVLLPGEIEHRVREQRLARGVPIDGATLSALAAVAAELGVELPEGMTGTV